MMPTGERSALEVIQAQVVLQLPVVLLDPPADLGPVDQLLQSALLRQGGEPVLEGFRRSRGPLHQQPLHELDHLAAVVSMRGLHPQGGEAAGHRSLAPFPPGHGLPGALRQSLADLQDAGRERQALHLPWAAGRCRPPAGRDRDDLHGRSPDSKIPLHPDHVRQTPPAQLETELGGDAVPGISHDDQRWDGGPGLDLIDHLEAQLPLAAEGSVGGDPGLLCPEGILDPALRQVELEVEGKAPFLGGVVQAHPDLAVADLAEGAGVLPGHAHGMLALFGEAGVVEEPGCPGAEVRHHLLSELPSERLPIPGALADELLEGLFIATILLGHAGGGLSPPLEEKALYIESSMPTSLQSADGGKEGLEKHFEPCSCFHQRFSVHALILA